MRVILVRHGRAGDALSDEERRLTEAGREGVTRVARHMAGQEMAGAVVHSSPFLRALETAEIVARETSSGAVRVENGLASGAPLDDLIRLLEAHQRERILVLVGHMPDLGVLAGWLAWGARSRVIELVPGAAVHFTVSALRPEPRAVMDWLVTPQDV